MPVLFRSAVVVVPLLLVAGCEVPAALEDTFQAADFVSDDDFGALVIEVDAVAGKNVDDRVYDRVRAALSGLSDVGALEKDAVTFNIDDVEADALGDEEDTHTFSEVRAAHTNLIDQFGDDDEAVIHLLWVDGRYEDDDGSSLILGFAYGDDRIVMLRDNIDRACRGSIIPGFEERLCERTTAMVLVHELGHLFGLVNNGAPMVVDHQDEDHGAHDDNEDCVMFFAVEGSGVTDVIGDHIASGSEDEDFTFDDNCLDDLRALANDG